MHVCFPGDSLLAKALLHAASVVKIVWKTQWLQAVYEERYTSKCFSGHQQIDILGKSIGYLSV